MPLTIFPAYGLDNSLLTAVLVGLYVRLFFTEWLGWVYSGLVVPGYLASVILLRPVSAAVIVLEAILTFLVVRGVSTLLSVTKLGTPVFGRDRFLWLVVVSVGVRVAIEALLAPWLTAQLHARLGWAGGENSGFYSIGLVLVPLLANACWKPGLVRGSVQQLVCTAVTYFLIRGLLLTTNLSLASVDLCFKRIAVDFAASPKAYLLLVAGALVASRANLRFGWDTSGVVIPGLLSLGWFAPLRLLSTLCEAMLIAVAASLFVRLPRVRDWNVEGPRRVAMLFTLGYLIKFCIVAVLGAAAPSFTATELFGIGYLLPSLLAVKIWQRRDPTLVLLPAVNLSLAGLGVGSLIGYGLLASDEALQARREAANIVAAAATCGPEVSLLSEVRLARARVARTHPSAVAPRISSTELTALDGMLRRLRSLAAGGTTSCAQLAKQLGPGALGLRLQAATSPAGRQFYTLREETEDPVRLRGFGLFAVAAHPQGGPVLVLERPQHDLTDLGALVSLVDVVNADAVVIGGIPQPVLWRGDVLRDRNVPLRVAIKALAGQSLTVRTSARSEPHLTALVPDTIARPLAARLGPLSRGGFGRATEELELPLKSEQALAAPLLSEISHLPSIHSWLAAVAVLMPKDTAPPRSKLTDLVLAEDVIRPLARARTPVDLLALGRLVAGAAHDAGLTVALIDGPRPRLGLWGYGEGLLIDPGYPEGAVIEVASRRPGIAELSTALFDAYHGHALLAIAPTPGVTTAGPLAQVAAALLAMTPPSPDVVIVQAGSPGAADCTIVSDELRFKSVPSPLAQGLAAALAPLGVHAQVHTQYDAETLEPPSRSVSLLRIRGTGDFVTLRAGPQLRDRFRPAPLTSAQHLLLARLGVPLRHVALTEPLLAACAGPAAPKGGAIPRELLRDIRAFAATRHPVLLSRLRARAQASHLALTIVEDDLYGDAYLLVVGKHGTVATTLRASATDSVSLLCRGDVAARIQKAQAERAAIITVGAP